MEQKPRATQEQDEGFYSLYSPEVLAREIITIKQEKEMKGLKLRKEEVSFFTIGDAQLLLKSPLETLCPT